MPMIRAMHTARPSAVAQVELARPHRRVSSLRTDAERIPDFCRTCALYDACSMVGYGRRELSPLHALMEHLGPYRTGTYLFRGGDPFDALFAIRAGTVKITTINGGGQHRVLGFQLPGEIIGLYAIYPAAFPYDVIALENVQLCRFPFAAISELARHQPVVQQHLFRLLSEKIQIRQQLSWAGEHGATERIAAFLIDLGRRYTMRGLDGTRFRLSMSRTDIANYLGLAAETVSRTLTRFRTRGWIELEGRWLELRERSRLQTAGAALLPT